MLAVDHESQTILHRAALSRDVSIVKLLAEKRYTLRTINVDAEDNSGKTARQRLETVEPSAELLKAFTAMSAAIESARQSIQVEEALARRCENDPDVFKDANEYQSGGSPTSSSQTTDSEELSARARRKGGARLTQPLKEVSRNWASKYRNTFRSFDRQLDRASASTVTFVASRPNG